MDTLTLETLKLKLTEIKDDTTVIVQPEIDVTMAQMNNIQKNLHDINRMTRDRGVQFLLFAKDFKLTLVPPGGNVDGVATS
jgi:hypothetical protein